MSRSAWKVLPDHRTALSDPPEIPLQESAFILICCPQTVCPQLDVICIWNSPSFSSLSPCLLLFKDLVVKNWNYQASCILNLCQSSPGKRFLHAQAQSEPSSTTRHCQTAPFAPDFYDKILVSLGAVENPGINSLTQEVASLDDKSVAWEKKRLPPCL